MLIRKIGFTKVELKVMKALYDVALANRGYTSDNSGYAVRSNRNIYTFIYGKESGYLNYRERSISDMRDTYSIMSDIDENVDTIYVIRQDIINCYTKFLTNNNEKDYVTVDGHNYYLNSIKDALKVIVEDVKKLILRLYHNETIYTLFLETPPGRCGFRKRVKDNTKTYGTRAEDIVSDNEGMFRRYLIRKNIGLTSTNLDKIDMQGLLGYIESQYFSEVAKDKNSRKEIVLSAEDKRTSKGYYDEATEKLLESKESTIPDDSLKELFMLCREIDRGLFSYNNMNSKRPNEKRVIYSILEWYCTMAYNNSEDLDSLRLLFDANARESMYQSSFDSVVMTGDTLVTLKSPSDFLDKIRITSSALDLVYNEWYMKSTQDNLIKKINDLCEYCEENYGHLIYDLDSGKYIVPRQRITSGLLDVGRKSQNNVTQGITHYVNLEAYNSMSPKERDEYVVLTKYDVRVIDVYSNRFINRRVRDELRVEGLKNGRDNINSSRIKYILLSEGYKRIDSILKIFSELDSLKKKLDKCGHTLWELLPVYYSGCITTIRGALQYGVQSKRLSEYEYSTNDLFTRETMLNVLGKDLKHTEYDFDWSLPVWGNKETNNLMHANTVGQEQAQFTVYDYARKLTGIGNINYPKYLESSIFAVLSYCFPNTLSDMGKTYDFRTTVSVKADFISSNSDNNSNANTEFFVDDNPTIENINNGLTEEEKYKLLADTFGIINDTDGSSVSGFVLKDDTDDIFKLDNLSLLMDMFNKNVAQRVDFDLEQQFYANATVNSLYSIVCLLVLVSQEFNLYTSNKYFDKDVTPTPEYNIFKTKTGKNEKIFWSSNQGVLNNTQGRSFSDVFYFDGKEIKYYPGRVEDILIKIPDAFASALSDIGLSSKTVKANLLPVIFNRLSIDKYLALSYLMEESVNEIQKLLLDSQKRLDGFNLSSTDYYIPVFASMDTIMFYGRKYSISVKNGLCYVEAGNNYKDAGLILPGILGSDNTQFDFELLEILTEVYNRPDQSFSNVLNVNDCVSLLNGLEGMPISESIIYTIKRDTNKNIITFIKSVWEQVVKVVCTKIFKMFSENSKNFIPIIFNTTSVFSLIINIFCAGEMRSSVRNTNHLVYKNPNIAPDEIIVKSLMPGQIGKYIYNWNMTKYIAGSIDTGWSTDTNDTVVEYPVAVDYLSAWNCSKIILESFSDVHMMAYVCYNISTNYLVSYNAEYSKYVLKELMDVLWRFGNKSVPLITALSFNAKNNIINNGNGQRFKPINLIFDVSGKSDVYDKLRKSLIAQQNATLDYVISEVNVGLEKPPVGEDYISEFSARINAMKKRIQPFSNNHGAYVNSNVNNQEKIRDIYKKYRDLIKRFVTYRASQLTVMEIDSNSAVMKRHRLTDERAYANNFYDIDSGTGILMRDSNVPIVKRKGHCIGFLHKSSCWIVIDTMVVSIEENKKSLASVRVVPYGEF